MTIPPVTPKLLAEIQTLREKMLKVHYFEEAHWLDVALKDGRKCRSLNARSHLQAASVIARQFGAPNVADWIAAILAQE